MSVALSGTISFVVSKLSVIAIDAVSARVVVDFWCEVLGWEVLEEGRDGISIGARERSGPTIDVFEVPEAKQLKNRLHFDLRADGVSTAEELKRLVGLGARAVDVGQPTDASWVVLCDPEGNEFCLLSRNQQEFDSDC